MPMKEMQKTQSPPDYRRRFLLLGLGFALVFLGSFLLGRYAVSLETTLRILGARLLEKASFGAYHPAVTWTGLEESVVMNIRLPRILCAALVGAALSTAGVMISSLFSGCTSFVKLVADTQEQLPAITYWLMGSLSSVKGEDTAFAAWPILLGLIPLILLRWRINLLTVSEAEARSMGLNTSRLRLAVILCATLVTAASVAVSGMIGWVGLVIPHFCRMLFGYDYRRIIPGSILMGGAFLMLVDDIARVITTGELPLGILTSFVGAPVFLYLIMQGGAEREH